MLTIMLLLAAGTVVSLIIYFKSREDKFKARVKKITTPQESFEVSITGPLKNRTEKVSYTVTVSDETNGQETPLRSDIGQLDEEETHLQINIPPRVLPRQKIFMDWQKILTIPVEKIEVARQGNRTLVFRVQVNKQPTIAADLINCHYDDKGFLDIKEHLLDIYTAVFYLAAGLRSILPAGSFDQKKMNEWLLEAGQEWSEEEQKNITQQYQSIALSTSSLVDWEEAYSFYSIPIQRHANTEIRNRIIQLFFQLLEKASDGVTEKQKLEILYNLSTAIGADLGQFCRLAERVFPESYHQMHENLRLGIHEKMSISDIRRRLKEEYKTWNARVTHPNQQFRKRAETMLELIALKQGQLKTELAS